MWSQGHQNLKEIGNLQTKQCINVYHKNSKEKKGATNNKRTIRKQPNKTGEAKSLTDYPIWMYQSLLLKIISKVKTSSLQVLMNRKRQGKKVLQILFYLPQRTYWVTYLKIPGRWSLQGKKFFAQDKHAGRCTDSCSKEWLNCALEDLQETMFHYCSPYSYLKQAVVAYRFISSNIQ